MDDVLRPTVDSVLRLVRALVADPHAADDLAQEAWLAALRKRVAEPELGRWLFGAARRLARSARRDSVRRREREERAPERGASPSALDSAARLELVKRVVTAVEALDEPYRTAVVLRYFEELPPRAIARRLGVPVNTVRSRVRRGIEALRERLDPAGLVALLPPSLTGPRGQVTPRRYAPSAAGLAGGVVLIGAVVLATIAPWRGHEPGVAAGDARTALGTADGGSGTVLDDPRAGARSPATAEARQPFARTPDSAPGGASPGGVPEPAEIRGRVLDAGGSALAGVQLGLTIDCFLSGASRSADPAGGLEAALRAWSDPQATTGTDGRFVLRFDPPAGLGFALELALDPTVRTCWHLFGIEPGEELDLGPLVLERGAALTGRVLDERGVRAVAWQVEARATRPAPHGEIETSATVAVDPASGAFRIDGLPPGTYALGASSPLGTIQGPTLELARGQTLPAELVFRGPEPSRRLAVSVAVRGFSGVFPAPESIELAGPLGAARHPSPLDASSSSVVFEDVPPGAYTLAVADPRFLPWRREGVEPGTRVSVELRGAAALVLRACDRRTGAVVERFAVALETRDAGCPRRVFVHPGTTPLSGGVLPEVVPGDYALTASAPGYGLESLDVVGLAAGETRALELRFGIGSAVAGHVRRDGAAVADATVVCLTPAERDDCAASPLALGGHGLGGDWQVFRRELARTRCDAAGAYRIELPRPGTYFVTVLSDRARPVGLQAVQAGPERTVELELESP